MPTCGEVLERRRALGADLERLGRGVDAGMREFRDALVGFGYEAEHRPHICPSPAAPAAVLDAERSEAAVRLGAPSCLRLDPFRAPWRARVPCTAIEVRAQVFAPSCALSPRGARAPFSACRIRCGGSRSTMRGRWSAGRCASRVICTPAVPDLCASRRRRRGRDRVLCGRARSVCRALGAAPTPPASGRVDGGSSHRRFCPLRVSDAGSSLSVFLIRNEFSTVSSLDHSHPRSIMRSCAIRSAASAFAAHTRTGASWWSMTRRELCKRKKPVRRCAENLAE